MHPFIDLKALTDEDIISKIGKAYSYMNAQVALGHTPTVESIKLVIQTLEDERHARLTRTMDAEFKKKYPKDLDPIELGKLENKAGRDD